MEVMLKGEAPCTSDSDSDSDSEDDFLLVLVSFLAFSFFSSSEDSSSLLSSDEDSPDEAFFCKCFCRVMGVDSVLC